MDSNSPRLNTVQSTFQTYFGKYETPTTTLQSPLPPEPLYSAPLSYWSIAKKGILDVAALSAPFLLIYSIGRFCLSKIAPTVAPRPFPLKVTYALNVLIALGAYRIVQAVVGFPVHPAILSWLKGEENLQLYDQLRSLQTGKQMMRISARSEMGHRIDGVFIKNTGVDLQGRCLLISPPNEELYENILDSFTELSTELKANILIYNYAGVGRSTGWFPNRDAMAASHKAMRGLLEELESKEICDFGWSIGGGVKWQSHAEAPPENPNKYVSIDYQTFRSVANIGYQILWHFGSWGVSLLQWNYDNERAIKQSQCGCIPIDCTGDKLMQEGNRPTEIEKLNESKIVVERGRHGSPLDTATISEIAIKVNAHFSNCVNVHLASAPDNQDVTENSSEGLHREDLPISQNDSLQQAGDQSVSIDEHLRNCQELD
ncbi:MAG: hypothetical protein KDK71_06330 [Chlamydiia bacterium]|nr:hypothetical protein [Chlamydiia bacterium]